MRVSTSFGGHSESNFAASSKMISHSGSSAAFLPRLASPFILLVNILDFDQSFGARIFISPRISQSQVRSGCSSGSYKAQFSNLTSSLSFHSFFIFPPFVLPPPLPPLPSCLVLNMSSSPSPFRPAATAPGPLTPSDDIDRLLNQSLGDDADMPGSGGHSPFLSFDAWGGAAVAGHSPASGPVRSNELAFVRSLCNKHSFTPYQREELEGLAANVCCYIYIFSMCSYYLFFRRTALFFGIYVFTQNSVSSRNVLKRSSLVLPPMLLAPHLWCV